MDKNIEFLLIGFLLGGITVFLFLMARSHSSPSSSYTLQPIQSKVIYSNLEEWEIIRDKEGRISVIKVHRRAEES